MSEGSARWRTRSLRSFRSTPPMSKPSWAAGRCSFHKPPSKVEVLNDLDGEMVNFFRVCQLHYEELLRYLRFMLVSRKWFDLAPCD